MAINPFWMNPFGQNVATSGMNPTPPQGHFADPPATGTGFFGRAFGEPGSTQSDAMMTAAASLLAGSGWSPVRQSSASILGQALLAGQQARAQTQDRMQKQKLQDAQIAALSAKENPNPFGQVDAAKYTPESISKFERSHDYGDLEVDPKVAMGSIPATLQEWEYYNKLRPEDQKRFLELKRSQQTYALGEVGGAPGAFNRQQGTFTPLATTAQEAAGKGEVAGAVASSQAKGTAQGGAEFDLPRVQQNVTQALDTIDKLIKSPGLGSITGLASKIPIIPGTDQAAADALAKQVEGQTFLQAFQSLKGGGAITETEGQKGTAAIARLQRAQSKEDYVTALKDARAIFQTGLDRISKQAGVTPDAAPVVRRKFNPATGKIE